jgi:hypothetical protein
MRIFRSLALALAACGDNVLEPTLGAAPPAAIDPTSCEGFAAISEPAADVGEVLLETRVITPGISYTCDDVTVWSYWARRRLDDGRLGSYGKFRIASTECAWFDALETRTPAVGTCP